MIRRVVLWFRGHKNRKFWKENVPKFVRELREPKNIQGRW